MTDTVQLALIVGLPPTLVALSGLIVSLRNGTKQDATAKKADTIIEKATEIHTLTNSNLAKVSAALDVALAKIEGQGKLIESLVTAKAVADKLSDKIATGSVGDRIGDKKEP